MMKQARFNKIALLGGGRVGKDTFASYINALYGFERFAFGDGMREAFHDLFPHIPAEPKPREEYIKFAQTCRGIDQGVWVRKGRETYNAMKGFGIDRFVVTDVRQQNEIDWLRSEGFIFVRITSDKQVERVEKLGETLDLTNELDNALNDFDCLTIDNSGTLQEFYDEIEAFMSFLGHSFED